MSCFLWSEPWGQDIHNLDGGDVLYDTDTGPSEIEVRADLRELDVVPGYEADYLWDDATGWC